MHWRLPNKKHPTSFSQNTTDRSFLFNSGEIRATESTQQLSEALAIYWETESGRCDSACTMKLALSWTFKNMRCNCASGWGRTVARCGSPLATQKHRTRLFGSAERLRGGRRGNACKNHYNTFKRPIGENSWCVILSILRSPGSYLHFFLSGMFYRFEQTRRLKANDESIIPMFMALFSTFSLMVSRGSLFFLTGKW